MRSNSRDLIKEELGKILSEEIEVSNMFFELDLNHLNFHRFFSV